MKWLVSMDGSPQKPATPRRKRRWGRRLAVLVLLVLAGAVWLNGPGVRWLGRLALERVLPMAGLTGEFRLDGTILGGLALRDVDLTGDQAVRRLAAGEIAVDYRLGELVKGTVRGLRVRDLAAVVELNVPQRTPPVEEDKKPFDPARLIQQVRDGLAKAHQHADPLEVDLQGLAVELLQDGKPVFTLGSSSLVHRGAGAPLEFRLGEMVHGGERRIPAQQFTVDWSPAGLGFSPFSPLARWSVDELRLDTGGTAPLLRAALGFDGRRLELDLTPDARRATARFAGDPLPWSALAEALGLKTDFQFELRRLTVEVDGLGRPAAEWKSTADVEAGALAWQDWQADSLALDLQQDGARAAANWRLAALDGTAAGTATTRWPDAARLLEDPVPPRVEGTLEVDGAAAILTALRERVAIPRGDAPFPGRRLAASWTLDLADRRPAAATAELTVEPAPDSGAAPVKVAANWSATAGLDAHLSTAGVLATATLDEKSKVYQGALDVHEPGVATLRAWAAAFVDKLPTGLTATAVWSGGGTLGPAEHHGKLDLRKFRWVQPDQPPLDAYGTVSYRWPGPTLEIGALTAKRGELTADFQGKLADRRLELAKFSVIEGTEPLAGGTASIPLAEDPADWRAMMQLDQPWQLDLATSELGFERINGWLPPQQKLPARGSLRANVKLAGTPAKPLVTLDLTGTGLQAAADKSQVPPAALAIKLATRQGRLEASGRLEPQGWSPVVLEASAPLDHAGWLADPQSIRQAKLQARAEIPPLDLARLGPLPAAIKRLGGTLDARLDLTGTPAAPRFAGRANLRGFTLEPADERIATVRNGRAELRLDGTRITLATLDLEAAGGRLRGGGSVDLADPKQPLLDLRVDGTALPAWRDPSTIVRLDANLRLTGRLAEAALSGRVAAVQSLYFRDFELIPIGIPFTTPSRPVLPKFDAPAAGPAGPRVPAPFAGWRLDLEVLTRDPFLVRGNLVQGTVTGNVRIGGTLGAPAPRGELTIERFEAQLPLSRLRVRDGKVRFRPEAPFAPALEIRGTSMLSPYEINVFVHGTAAAPEITFTSSPPLPENEILTLLATGATSSDLERQGAASNKAIQLLLEEARRGRLRYGKFLKPVLEVLKDVDIRIGEVDPYTGRDFSSATLRLSDRWLTSFAIDDENRSRGLLIFVLRFR